jgi:hypothetical protein
MMLYVLPATLTFGLTLEAVFHNPGESGPSEDAWLLIGLVTVFWPITLPCILLSQYRKQQAKLQQVQDEAADQYATT